LSDIRQDGLKHKREGNCGREAKKTAMIKGIIGYKVLRYEDLEPILMKLRSHAMQYPGFIGAENLVSEEDLSVVMMTTTWQTIENWRTWAESNITQDLLRQSKEVAVGTARLTAYRIMPTTEWRR
jgi:heme-degrading monooxygenase HmoA